MRLRFLDDGSVQVRTGKVELGQGILTALGQIAADALGLPPGRVHVLAADTAESPDEGVTSGSLSVQDAGAALRRACVEALESGVARGDAAGVLGQSLLRVDLPAKLSGQAAFIHDMVLPGLLHGRVLHPPQVDALLLEADTAKARAVDGVVAVHRDGRLLGVLAEHSALADEAASRLADSARWQPVTRWTAPHDLQRLPATTHTVAAQGARPEPTAVARTLKARYTKPWISHASLAPSCALARWDTSAEGAEQLQVWTHSQGIFHLRRDLALAFGVPEGAVRVQHVEGAGCYGHNGADDVAFDAAWLARQAPGRPVRVLWSRADEFTQSPFGPAMVVALEADLDAHGEVLHWRHHVWSPGHSGRPGRSATPALLGSWQTERAWDRPPSINMPLAVGGGSERNAVPGYALPAFEVINHLVSGPLPRSSALRSLGAFANVFAAESFVDEIVHATGDDPLAWRRRHLAHDARALAVLNLAAESAGWADRVGAEGVGHGIGVARYKNTGAWCAVVAEVEAGATLVVRRLTIAVDVGLAVNPDGVVAQIEGGAIQATSWALKEAVQFEHDRVATRGWADYPTLKFTEVPAIDVHVMPSSSPSLGAGEAALGPTAAAIANALFDALGLRVRDLPLTPERIVAAMDGPLHSTH